MLDWYLPRLGARRSDRARAAFRALWSEALAPADRGAADLGVARLSFPQPAVAAASATALPGSASWISRMP